MKEIRIKIVPYLKRGFHSKRIVLRLLERKKEKVKIRRNFHTMGFGSSFRIQWMEVLFHLGESKKEFQDWSCCMNEEKESKVKI